MPKIISIKISVDGKDVDKLSSSVSRLSDAAGNATKQRIISNLTSRAITEAIGLTKDFIDKIQELAIESVKLAANFQDTTNALAVFTGSTRLAKQELAEIDAVAASTPGLRLLTAEEGYQKLRALGFQAEQTKKLVAGLGNQKILSGADESAVDRVIVNLTQIRASSKDASRDIKEMVKAIPSLSGVFQDAFGTSNTSELRSLLQQDPKKFFDKLANGLAEAQRAEGGFNDAFGKLMDAFISAERTFGKPLLEPLTAEAKDLTHYINENKETWRSWGEDVAGIIRATKLVIENIPEPPKTDPNSFTGRINSVTNFNLTDYFKGDDSAHSLFDYFVEYGKRDIKKEQESKPLSDDFKLYASRIEKNNTFDLSADGKEKLLETKKERFAREKVLEDERLRDIENTQIKELALLKNTAAEAQAILKNRYEREQSVLELSNRFTAEQEIEYQKQSGASKSAFVNSEIARVSGFYNKQIELQNGNDAEISKLASERNKTLDGLNSELFTDSLKTQKQIQDLENRIYEERRQSAIEFSGLQIKESESAFDKQAFNISRAIERQNSEAQTGFEALKSLTQSNYEEVSALTKAQYEKQLENLSLTDEQKANIIKDSYLTQQGLAEKNRRAILDIEDRQYQKSLSNIETAFNRRKDLLESYSQSTQFGIGLLSPDAFASNSSSLIQRALTGSDLQSLKDQTQSGFTDKGIDLFHKKAEVNFKVDQARQANDGNGVIEFSRQLIDLDIELNQNAKNFENWGDFVDDSVLKVDSLVEKIKNGSGAIADFDALGLESLKLRQQRESSLIDSEIASYAKRAELAAKNGETADSVTFTYAKLNAERKKGLKGIEDEAEQTAFLAQTTKGLNEQLDKLLSRDKVSVDLVKKDAGDSFIKEKISLAKENIALESSFYTDSVYLAELRKNKLLGFEREVFELRQKIAEKGVFDRNESDAKVLGYLNSQIKGVSETFADFRIGIAETFFDAVTSPFDKLSKKLKVLNPIVRGLAQTFLNLSKEIIKAFSQKLILRLLGLETGTGGASAGGVSSGGGMLGNISGIIKNLFGGGSGSRAVTSASGGVGGLLGAAPGAIGSSFVDHNGKIVTVGGGGTGAGGFLSSIQSLLPVAGIGLGSTLGGGSGAGSILGSLGGGLLGTVGAAFGSSSTAFGGAFGSIGGLLGISGAATLGIGAAVGGAVLLGSYLLGRNARRNKEEKQRSEYINQAFTDIKQFDTLISDVRALKIRPASSAIPTGETLGKNIHDQYIQASSQLKDKKTRNIALKDVSRIDSQIAEKMDSLKKAVSGAQDAEEFSNKFVPTFATGGYMDGGFNNQYKDFKRRNGFLAGGVSGVDSLPSLLMPREIVANEDQQERVRRIAGFDVFAYAGIPNYPNPKKSLPVKMATGGFVGGQNIAVGSIGQSANSNQTAPIGNIILQGVVVLPDSKAWLETPGGKRQVISIVKDDLKTNLGKNNADGIAREAMKSIGI